MNRIAFVAAGVAALLIAGAASAQSVGIGTGPQASLTNRIGSGVAKVITDAAGLKTRAVPHTSNAQHTPLVEKGTLTFGVSSTGDINDALAGRGAFEGHPVSKDFVIAGRLVPLPVGTLVRKDSPYRTLNDMKGKKYACGFTAQKTVLNILNGYLSNAGMSSADLDCVNVPNTSAGTELFLKGTVEGTPSSLGGARLRDAAAKVNGIRVLNMYNTPDAVKAMQKEYPGSYLIKLDDKTVGVEGETWTMAFDMVLMTSTKAPDDVIYKSVKALYEGKDEMVKVSPVFRAFDPKNMIAEIPGVGVHPGALKFYKEFGIDKGTM
jgi:hypothetical protein